MDLLQLEMLKLYVRSVGAVSSDKYRMDDVWVQVCILHI